MITAKDNARTRLLGARKAMPPGDRAAADAATWNALRAFLDEALDEGATVAAYRPFGSEPCAMLRRELPERLAERYTVLLPVTLPDNDLDWTVLGSHVVTPGTAERPWSGIALTGPRGSEEVAPACGVEAIGRAGAVIVPGLAVSHDGIRLGRGGGCYDRALARLAPAVPVVALLRDGEFGLAVPAERHDRPVTGVVTPTGGYTPAG
ncbi:5-formyltetrahydrofolate cyclo-ligase [Glycomyces arizonensis]|uniref:5-formyltetrahydrofolate cyclo-ligase n=1 Tax=Glycomyces arizonensis TaxID=256035 RepID=UPI000410522D|nr:5-formyltetrahydrofolate cyclo-ligase [Glycomyces arizonensis]